MAKKSKSVKRSESFTSLNKKIGNEQKRKPLTPEQKRMHALRQQAYKIRKSLSTLDDSSDLKKAYRKLININSEQETLREVFKIGKRRSKVEIKAEQRSGKLTGVVTQYHFYDANKLKKQLTGHVVDGLVRKINGIDATKNPVRAFVQLDSLFTVLSSRSALNLKINPNTKEATLWVTGNEEEEEEEEEL